jgi:hypothetical protein
MYLNQQEGYRWQAQSVPTPNFAAGCTSFPAHNNFTLIDKVMRSGPLTKDLDPNTYILTGLLLLPMMKTVTIC